MRARVKPAVWAAWCAQSGITGHPEHEYQPVEDTDRVGNHRLSWPFWWWKLEELDFEPPGYACKDCGHCGGPFRTVEYTAGDFDLECPECESNSVDEIPAVPDTPC